MFEHCFACQNWDQGLLQEAVGSLILRRMMKEDGELDFNGEYNPKIVPSSVVSLRRYCGNTIM